MYFGKASQRANGGGLWDRINEYSIAGKGQKNGHSGGEYIWQLADARDLLVAWKVTPAGTEKKLEEAMIFAFKDKYGKIPFANRTSSAEARRLLGPAIGAAANLLSRQRPT